MSSVAHPPARTLADTLADLCGDPTIGAQYVILEQGLDERGQVRLRVHYAASQSAETTDGIVRAFAQHLGEGP